MASSGKDGKRKNKVSPEFNVSEDLTVNGNIIFTPALNRDIIMSQNIGGIRIFTGSTLTTSPSSAAIQFFGNGHAGFPGQAFIDSGANNSAALIFRTAQTGGTITERMRVNSAGNVGIGTNMPQQNLSVNAALNVDQANLNNGTFNPGITFGSFSAEGISSKRTAGGNLNGLDFYTNTGNRMSITNNGNVGIGTTAPQQNLSVNAALVVDQAALNFGSVNPGITFGASSGEGVASKRTAGGNQFGLDFFTGFASRMSISNSGDVNVAGNLAANNLPGVRFGQTHCADLSCAITVTPGSSYTADTIAVSVPAAGFLFISAFANISNLGNPFFDVEFNLFQCADINCNSSTLLSSTNPKAAMSSAHISWVIPVTGSGFVFLRTSGVSHNSSNDVHIFDHSLTAIYLPKGY